MNILIVDDDLTNLELLRIQLESEGHAVFAAHDGVDALALLERQRVDAVISDILMPRMDGYQFCHEIRKHARLRDLPIIIYSAIYTAPEDEKRALDIGANKYLEKPASVAIIITALQEVIAQPHAAPRPDARPEVGGLKEYNERLVSKLKEKNKELLAQTEALRLPNAAMTAAGNAILIANRDGIIVWVNPAFSTLTGYTLAEVVGKNPRDLVKSGQQERAVYEEMWATILAGRIWHGQIVNHRKDGSLYPEEQTITPVRDANGEITHFIAIKQDLSERKKAEQKLRESERRFSDMLENVELVSVMLDHEARITYCNDYLLHLTGWRHEEVIGRNWSELFVPPGINYMKDAFVALLANRPEAWHRENEILTRSGERRLIRWNNSVLRSGAGDVIGTASIGEDITERKRADQALARLVAIIEATPDMVATGDPNGHVLYYNRAGLRMLGFEPGLDVSTVSFLDTHPEWAAKLVMEEGIPHAIEHGTWSGETALLPRDGREIPISQVIIAHKGSDGSVEYLSTIARDITQRKRAEEEIRTLNADLERRVAERTRQFEEASRAKSDFLANMSHELRTPLNSIIGCSELLKDGVLGELEAKQRSFVADIFDAGSHLLLLINDILDLSKVEAGMLQLEAGAVDVAALLKASMLIVREKALAHRIRLDTQLDPALGIMLADERKLKQIVYNLLSNAVKFTPDGGTMTLSARRCARAEVAFDEALPARLIALPPGEDDGFLAITVEDTGVGIPEEHLPKLFERFTQLDSSVSRRHAGTGLGLSLVRRLAELHGGTVGVASRPGVGSRFCVWLPWREAPSAPVLPKRAGDERGQPMARILVVDDDPRNLKLAVSVLEQAGHEVLSAKGGAEGIEAALAHAPDLIIMDVQMPGMDGIAALKRLRAEPRTAGLKVVAFTALAMKGDAERLLAEGFDGYLEKPIRYQEFLARVAALLAREQVIK